MLNYRHLKQLKVVKVSTDLVLEHESGEDVLSELVSSIAPQYLAQGIKLVVIGHRETEEEEVSWWLNLS